MSTDIRTSDHREAEISRLERQIAQLKRERDEESKARRESVKPEMRFTLTRVNDTFNRVMDPSVIHLRLEGHLDNEEEMREVGHRVEDYKGGQTYLFNTLSSKFISGGGGRVWLTHKGGFSPILEAFDALAVAYNEQRPGFDEPIDVTEIVNSYRAER